MQRSSLYTKDYSSRKKEAARRAVKAARAALIASGRSTGGSSSVRYRSRGSELKAIDSGTTTDSLAPTAVCTLINGVATGDDYNTRDGRRIVMKGLTLKFGLFDNGTTGPADFCRVMVILDKQANGAVCTSAQLFTANTPISPMNLDNRERFKILKDWCIGTDYGAYAAGVITNGATKMHVVKTYIPMDIPVTYSGTGATIASIATNALYLVYQAKNSNTTTIYYNARVRFTEP